METKTLLEQLQDQFTQAIAHAFLDLDENAIVTQSTSEKFGHYQCNSALKLGKLLKQNPRDVAQKLVDHVDQEGIAQLDIAGPGFINITLDANMVAQRVNRLLDDPRLGVPPLERQLRAIVEFSSPNTAKEMHVGHLRSTIIGECIARLLEFYGHDVLRLNHVGDWGTQFGMLIAFIKDEAPDVLSGGHDVDPAQLVAWYRAAKKRFDEDETFKRRSQLEVVALQGGDADSLAAWKTICAISRQAYQEIYDMLDVTLTERGESYYNPVLADTVQDLENKNLVQISQGAKCIYLPGFTNREGDPLPLMIQKSDGGYLYGTTDMAAIRQRIEEEKAEWIIYITDMGQATHFAMIFKAAELAGYYNPDKVRIDHVPFGLVLGSDGKKFRTRAGETERLADLLIAAVARTKEILVERTEDMSAQEIDATARALGLGAVKYADLSQQRVKDYTFSYERMLRLEGNTAPFLMYAYVRMNGIKRKVGVEIDQVKSRARIDLVHPTELALGLHLCRFSEVLDSVTRDLMPHRLCEYLYQLAEHFHAFFRDCRVAGDPKQDSRLLLCEAAARILRQGLHILGLQVVDRM